LSIDTSDEAALGTDPLGALADRIRRKEAVVAVVGLGYVGLPLLLSAADAGFPVVGFDADPIKVDGLRHGRSHIVDVTDSDVASLENAEWTTDSGTLKRADVILIAVPTPLTDHAPDLSLVQRASEDVARQLTPGTLVVLESTTYPGTTEELLRPILEASGLEAGKEFALGYSPERIDPGQKTHRLENTPKIVAGMTERCREVATAFYSHFVREVVTTSTPREAEMAKLIENTFRQVNIALVNELAIMARELHVDIWESLEAASTKPFGYMAFWPGPGVGGHCISIDPSYLSWRAGQQLGYRINFIEHANEVNNRMPEYVVSRLGEALNDLHKPIRGTKVLAIGVTYKAGVDDQRESPALAVLERLSRKGAEVSYHDPFVPEAQIHGQALTSTPLTEETLAGVDCVVILTAHDDVDYRMLVREAPLVFDTRGVTLDMDAPSIVRL
jgi:UDP-N-acetyl-D-glucosamine dehydrogenase